ncbi:MAG: hypothetical protein KF862_02975 [Chitinophagaceae bacterium]|nr:hypothetical protein [Chitinophagaceae bacterium]
MPECFLDTNLVEALLNKPYTVNHKKGNSNIIKAMEEKRLKDSFVVALIDDDKVKVKALESYKKVDRLWRTTMKLFMHPERKHFVIQVSPAIEKWIMKECEKGKINMEEFGLPGNLGGLRRMKGLAQRNDSQFRELFKMMIAAEACDEIIEMKRWLIFFRDNNIQTNIDLL